METVKNSGVHVITVPRFEPRHILSIVLCLAGAAAILYVFWKDLNLTLERLYEEPLGMVERKHNIAQRRFADRTLWDRLRRQSPVYSGDYIRTAGFSGAGIFLAGGELLDLGEHTLIQIQRTTEGLVVELSGGELQADTGSGGLTLKAGDRTVQAGPGSILRAAVENGTGRADFVTDQAGPVPAAAASPPGLISPAEDQEFVFGTGRPGIRFVWTSLEGAGSYRLAISADPGMENPLRQIRVQDLGGTLSSIVSSGLGEGTWYWQVTPEFPRNHGATPRPSRTGSFRIRRAKVLDVPVQRSPPEQGSLYLEDKKQRIYFSWKQEADAASYTFLLSQREDLGSPLIKQQVPDNYIACDLREQNLSAGRYYWGVYQTDTEGRDSAPSAARSLIIAAGPPPAGPSAAGVSAPGTPRPSGESSLPAPGKAGADLAALPAPGNLRPAPGFVLTEEIILRDRQVAFSWNPVPGAEAYVFTLYQVQNGRRRELLQRTLKDPRFTLGDLTVLDVGAFVWSVEGSSPLEGQKGEGAESTFTVHIAETQASQGEESGVLFGSEGE